MGGEHDVHHMHATGSSGSPPHGRGTRASARTARRRAGLTPAWAGNTPQHPPRLGRPQAHPRMGGEHRGGDAAGMLDAGSPPHGRGTPAAVGRLRDQHRLTPAWAGNTCWSRSRPVPAQAHPRMGGEHHSIRRGAVHDLGSPPHGRGTPPFVPGPGVGLGLTPAWAGNTGRWSWCVCPFGGSPPHGRGTPTCAPPGCAPRTAHPRMGGEHAHRELIAWPARGSPPHGRGTPLVAAGERRLVGLTPAWAGNTRLSRCRRGSGRAHPRMGGEHGGTPCPTMTTSGSPPHGRGTHGDPRCERCPFGLTPAWAGNTRPATTGSRWRWAHPRMGGEHPGSYSRSPLIRGSPPHGRGTQ